MRIRVSALLLPLLDVRNADGFAALTTSRCLSTTSRPSRLVVSSSTLSSPQRRHSPCFVVKDSTESNNETEETQWENERQWLTWVYKRIEDKPVGELSSFVLRQMVPAMSAWARRKSSMGAQRAEFLMQRYVEEHLAGNQNAILDTRLFNICMDAWAKSRRPDAPKHVNHIMRWMKDLRKEKGMDNIRPDVVSMTTLVAAWARCGAPNAVTRAEKILQYMEQHNLNPNTITYNTVLHAYATGPMMDKAIRAEQLVQTMKDRFETGKHPECEPDVCTYQSLISAWARSGVDGAPQKAEEVLHFLEQEYKSGNARLEPNAHCFSAAIHAWSNSMEPHKARRAYTILQHMRREFELENNRRVKPNPIAFTSVINACASPVHDDEKEEAFRIAQLTMEELWYSRYGRANFVTYAAFLHVCATTLAPGEERDAIVERTFHTCCRAGQVGWKVLEKLEAAASPELYQELVAMETDDNGTRILDLPPKWNRNVKGEKLAPAKLKAAARKTISESTWSKLHEAREMQGNAGFYSREKKTVDGEKMELKWSVDSFQS